MHDDIKPETDIGGLKTSLHVQNLRMLPVGGIGMPTQGPVRSFAEARACGKVIIAGDHAVVYG
ncbi:MAG: hypothetical protein NTV34_01140, partial [Proteobacteria bacterium]|nr:hypothetical protein [Pseudomonadota bacterium]